MSTLPIAILMTSFGNFDPSYSLCTVVLDQARALDLAGFSVQIWVNQRCDLRQFPPDLIDTVCVRCIMPMSALIEDVVNEAAAEYLVSFLETELATTRPAVVITHDFLFVSWYVTFAAAIHRMKPVDGVRWYHQGHSAPNLPRVVTEQNKYRMNLPDGHFAICCNYNDRYRFAEYYGVARYRIVAIPNVRDFVSWSGMSDNGRRAFKDLKLEAADLVQIYPLSGTRMQAKGVDKVIAIFGHLKVDYGYNVRLVFANAHSSSPVVVETIQNYAMLARRCGLEDRDVMFTSQQYPETANSGIAGDLVYELLQGSNVFIFPTVSEAGPLVLLEAAMAGNILVLNRDVPALADIIPHDQALWFSFGGQGAEGNADLLLVAGAIDAAYRANAPMRARRTVLRDRGVSSMAETFRKVLRPGAAYCTVTDNSGLEPT